MSKVPSRLFTALLTCAFAAGARQTTANDAPQKDSSYIDANGTAHVTRVIPVPKTISPEAQQRLARPQSDAVVPEPIAERRSKTDKWQSGAGAEALKMYPAKVAEQTIAGVPVRIVTPLTIPADRRNRLLINVHGGGFNSDSGSLTETIPLANLSKTKVIAVLYRLAPEHPFPAAVDDAVAVYKEAIKAYRPAEIALYGTSAGAVLTGEIAVRLRQLHLPLPGALGIFSGFGDFSQPGDSRAIFALNGLSGPLSPPSETQSGDNAYVGSTGVKNPVLSPFFADLSGFPPTLFITSTRDLLLSGTTILHRAFLRAGVDARLVVFEALPHAFWNDVHLPESQEANQIMAKFFEQHLEAAAQQARR